MSTVSHRDLHEQAIMHKSAPPIYKRGTVAPDSMVDQSLAAYDVVRRLLDAA